MPTALDTSHQTVIEHWETITRMIECRKQVESYLMQCVVAAFERCRKRTPELLGAIEEKRKDRYVQFTQASAEKSEKSDSPLFGFGVEHISAAGILGISGAEPLKFYVFTSHREKVAMRLRDAAEPPRGFVTASGREQRDGYVHQAELPPLAKEEFCDPQRLERHFAEPLTNLVEWYRANQQRLLVM
jgi:hypothetical protein